MTARMKQLAVAAALMVVGVTGANVAPAGAAMNCTQLHRASARMAFYMDLYMDLGWYGEWEFAYMSWEYYENRIEASGC